MNKNAGRTINSILNYFTVKVQSFQE